MLNRLVLAGVLLLPSLVLAQEATPPVAAESAPVAAPVAPKPKVDPKYQLMLATPRTCYESFVQSVEDGKWSDAVACMDFSGFVSLDSKANGDTLAYKLKQIFDSVQIDTLLPDAPTFEGPCLLSDYVTDELGAPLDGSQLNDFRRIAISKSPTDGLWRFDAGTVTQIEDIFEKWEAVVREDEDENDDPKPVSVWLADQFPEPFHQKHFLIEDYKWICLAIVVALGFLADALVGFLALNLSQSWFGIERSEEKDNAIRQLWKPAGLLVQALVWYYGISRIGLPSWAMEYLSAGLRFFAVFAGIWVLFRLIDLAGTFFARRAERTTSKFDDLLVPLLSKTLKVLAMLFGVLICAETFQLPIKGLLGGLGLGGMALALASKDAVSNLFGSFTVLIDRPFEIGDWVITEDVEGIVEQVGFRSTRIRTFYNSLTTLPNSRLTTAVVDNMGRRRYRRVKTTIGVEYNTTPEQLDAFCEGIRELIRRNPATRKDYFHVYFNGFGDSSLDIMVYFFLRVPDWSMELKEKHRLYTEILRLAQELNVGFAFPTRTLHMHPETSPPTPHDLQHPDPEAYGRESAARIFEN